MTLPTPLAPKKRRQVTEKLVHSSSSFIVVQNEMLLSEMNDRINEMVIYEEPTDPDNIAGIYQNQSDFAKALFVGETPTLIYHPSNLVSHAKLSQLLPIAFPFGTGDVDCRRSPAVNEIECMQHYLRLSLPQFQEGQTILVIHHVYQRRKSFLTGIAKCNISNNGNTVANDIDTFMHMHIINNSIKVRKLAKRL